MLRRALVSSPRPLAGSLARSCTRPLSSGPARVLASFRLLGQSAAAPRRWPSSAPASAAAAAAAAVPRRWLTDRPSQDEAEPQQVSGTSGASGASGADAETLEDDAGEDAEDALRAEVAKWKDLATRRLADFYNLQNQAKRERQSTRDFAIQSFAKDLLETLDNFDRVLETPLTTGQPPVTSDAAALADGEQQPQMDTAAAATAPNEAANWLEGLRMTESVLLRTLERHGLTRVNPVGLRFDPNEHEAVFMVAQPDKEHNTVFVVQQNGYKLHGRTIRAAKVGVVKNS